MTLEGDFRKNLVRCLVLVAAIATFLNIPIFYYLNRPFSYLLMSYDIFYIFLYLSIRKKLLNDSLISNMTAWLFFIHMMTIPIFNGNNTMVIAWVTLFPIVIYSIKSSQKALYYSLSFLTIFFTLFAFSLLDDSYQMLNIFMIGMMFLVLTTVLYFILRTLESKERDLLELNLSLEKTVDAKTAKLQHLNTHLENEIMKQVNDIREKDKYLIAQSRLAAMGEMIGNIAHQWRQPLNALGLIQQKIQLFHNRGHLNGDKLVQNLDKSMVLIDSMSSTIDDFRNFFNPNKKKVEFAVVDVVHKAFSMIEASFKNNNIECRISVPDESLTLYRYQNELSQVILNLLNNAKDVLIEKGVDGAYVLIVVEKDKEDVVIECCDNGGGISTEIRSRIFEPYFTTKGELGTGLGLYMSKMIVEDNMNGKMEVSNTQEGVCFRMRFSPEKIRFNLQESN